MTQVYMTDNMDGYSNIGTSYISGNVVKVNAINLPAFVQEKNTQSKHIPVFEAQLDRPSFKVPLLFRANRLLQVILIVLSIVAVGAYSLEVTMAQKLTL